MELRSPDLIVYMCRGVIVSGPGGQAKRGGQHRTKSPVQTKPHWSFQYCFNPETTSDVVHGVEVSRLDCVCPCGVRNRGEARAPSVRTESPVRTEPHWSFQYCFNPEMTSDIGTE